MASQVRSDKEMQAKMYRFLRNNPRFASGVGTKYSHADPRGKYLESLQDMHPGYEANWEAVYSALKGVEQQEFDSQEWR